MELSHLEYLKIRNNPLLSSIPEGLFDIKNLKYLCLNSNSIMEIPLAIQNLAQLETLDLNNNKISQLPNELFNLRMLKTLDLGNNPELIAKINNFGNSTIENCYFHNINISCYEPNTCKMIHLNGISLSDAEVKNELKICTREENLIQDSKSNSLYIMSGIFFILIGIIILLVLIKKNRSKKRIKLKLNDVIYIPDNDDEFNINKEINNINNHNTDSNNNSHNNDILNNLNQNNSNDSNSSTYNNPENHNSHSNAFSGKSSINGNQNIINNSINTHFIPPPSYDEFNMPMDDESLPEYEEIN
ncbi:hypothetical protein U3516DRAFT_788891 [Neocallimastix sp. 'constans']